MSKYPPGWRRAVWSRRYMRVRPVLVGYVQGTVGGLLAALILKGRG